MLVAPVALYPDPLLVLVLQGSTFPVDVVAAHRFLGKLPEQPELQPIPAGDTSIVGLLNYPDLLARMDEELDWTAALGEAVLNQLEAVQGSIQQVRLQAYMAGMLRNRRQPRPSRSKPSPRRPAGLRSAAYVEPALAPATYQGPPPLPPVYASAPPVVQYSDPGPSFWSGAATFAGGAAIGGLLGYVIGDDDGDDWDWNDEDWDDVADDVDDIADDVDELTEGFEDFRDDAGDFIQRQVTAGTPFFGWFNSTACTFAPTSPLSAAARRGCTSARSRRAASGRSRSWPRTETARRTLGPSFGAALFVTAS
ncbi:MAG: DUF3300 domain-containing protein [Geminicoccaceae bacterium]